MTDFDTNAVRAAEAEIVAESERRYAATLAREEDEQDTPEAAAAWDRHEREQEAQRVSAEGYGTCTTCGDSIYPGDKVTGDEIDGFECEMCSVQPLAGPAGVEAALTPRADCTDPECAARATVVPSAVETRTYALLIVAEPNEGEPGTHLAIPGIKVALCMHVYREATFGTANSLGFVDCLGCLDKWTELQSR